MPTISREVPLSEIPKPWLQGVDIPAQARIVQIVINIETVQPSEQGNARVLKGMERLERMQKVGAKAGDLSHSIQKERESYQPRTFNLS